MKTFQNKLIAETDQPERSETSTVKVIAEIAPTNSAVAAQDARWASEGANISLGNLKRKQLARLLVGNLKRKQNKQKWRSIIKTYTVHSPPEDSRPADDRQMDHVFIKEGFSLWAAFLGPLWLVMKSMWVETGVYIAALITGAILMEAIGFHAQAISAAMLLANLGFGLFARDLLRFHIERKGYKFVSVVNGKTMDECETRFFQNSQPQS